MIFDMHTHIFPQKIAEKAVDAIGKFYDIPMQERGFSENLLAEEKAAGVDKCLVCSTATTPLQVTAINSFIAAECEKHPEFIGFGSLHPGFEQIEEEVARMEGLGLVGIKLHPDFQKFAIDDKIAYKIYEVAEGRLPILFHTGDSRYAYSNPERVLKVLKDFPKLKVICAHLGGYSEWQDVQKLKGYLGNPNIFIDTSSAIQFVDNKIACKIIKKHGTRNVFWGTDYPMWTPKTELENFYKLKLTDDEKEQILSQNPAKFLQLT